MKKTIFVTCGVLAMCFAAPVKADSVESYTGNTYTNVSVPSSGYTTASFITATLTFQNPLPANASLAYGYGGLGTPTATDPLLSFSISDGSQTFNLSNGLNIFLVTGSQGQIVSWFVGACGAPCSSALNIDTQFGLPKWTSVPEPSSLLMLGAGILGLAGFSLKRSLLTR
jgi:hypothetical protein